MQNPGLINPTSHFLRKQNAPKRPTFDFDTQVANFGKNLKQVQALEALDSGLIKFLLYGGAMGGGKSYFLRWYAERFLLQMSKKGLKNVQIMLACEDYPSLKDRQLSKIMVEFPDYLGKFYSDHKVYGACFVNRPEYGSGVICFRNLDDPSKYQSAEFAAILIDELTKNTYQNFNDLRTRLRWAGLTDMECPFVAGTNPGGIGHGWVKQLWMTKSFPSEWIRPIDYRPTFKYIPSLADDNPYLDESYWHMLETLPVMMRKAFRFGDWEIFVGQSFPELARHTHSYKRADFPVPGYSFILQTMDWGFGAPFSIGWWHTDNDGRLYRFAEWYGWNGMANEGLRLTDENIADGILEREGQLDLQGKTIIRKAGPDCFNKKPNYKGGGQGPSTAEVFRGKGLILSPADPDRKLKIRQFRERLRPADYEGNPITPMMLIEEGCDHFFRTMGGLIMDPNNIEDVDTSGEDHCLNGDTIVATKDGLRKIKDLVGVQGFIWTVENRWTPYQNCRLTRKNAETVKLIFADETEVMCTPDHEFFTASCSWKKAIDLPDETCYVSIHKPNMEETLCVSELSVPQFKSSMENAFIYRGVTFKTKASAFIEWFGNIITDQFLQAFISIIKTKTGPSMMKKILRRELPTLMPLITPEGIIMDHGFVPCTKGPLSGTEVKREENGTRNNTRSIARRPLPPFSLKEFVRNAVKSLAARRVLSIALVNANKKIGSKKALDWNQEPASSVDNFSRRHGVAVTKLVQKLALPNYDGRGLRVVKVQPSGNQDVYCLTVPKTHSFFLANNILSSNCYDEACHACMSRPMSVLNQPKIEVGVRRPPRDGSEVADMERRQIFEDLEHQQTGGEMPW